jgi:3-deoxy-D-manno-octulosonic-acid transferase
MSSRIARLALSAYVTAGIVAYPLARPYLFYRSRKGKEDRLRRKERFGFSKIERPHGPLIWVHAASVGETLALLPLIREIRARDIHVLLTTGTVTSAELVKNRLGHQVIHQYVPLDIKIAVDRFLSHWMPDAAITAESEIWPVTMLALSRKHIPQIRVNARLSDRSFARWQGRPDLAETLFGRLSMVVAQSDLDAERFRDLGAWPVVTSGNLKGDTDPPPCDDQLLAHYRGQIGTRKTWAAISTFDGEEAAAGTVQLALRKHCDLLTILVPRHPERADAIEAHLVSQGLKVARRSRGDVIAPETDIFLGDSIGEMGMYLRLTQIAFVGRSLTNEGGQNPLEPAMLGCAVLSGPHVQNFREPYQRLLRAGGAKIIRDIEMLTKGVYYLTVNDNERLKMIDASASVIEEMRGALGITMKALEPYMSPLTVSAKLKARSAAV